MDKNNHTNNSKIIINGNNSNYVTKCSNKNLYQNTVNKKF